MHEVTNDDSDRAQLANIACRAKEVLGLMGLGKAQGLTLSEGLALMEEAFARMVHERHYKFFGTALAEARFDAGRATDALALLDRAVNTEAWAIRQSRPMEAWTIRQSRRQTQSFPLRRANSQSEMTARSSRLAAIVAHLFGDVP
jgi:hypothetical protein